MSIRKPLTNAQGHIIIYPEEGLCTDDFLDNLDTPNQYRDNETKKQKATRLKNRKLQRSSKQKQRIG